MSGLSPEVRDFLCADYLRPERPSMASCFRRALAFALAKGLPEPSDRAMRRMLKRLPAEVLNLTRCGPAEVASSAHVASGVMRSRVRGRAGTKPVPAAGTSP